MRLGLRQEKLSFKTGIHRGSSRVSRQTVCVTLKYWLRKEANNVHGN